MKTLCEPEAECEGVMEDRRPPKLMVHRAATTDKPLGIYEATPADLIAAVRDGVESGTIEGKETEMREWQPVGENGSLTLVTKSYLVIGPLSESKENL